MSFHTLRRVHTPSNSPVEIYFKGITKTFLVLSVFLIAGILYFFNVNQGVYHYSLGALIAIISSVFIGGYSSGRNEKGWFYGLLIGLTYGFILVFLEDFLADGNLSGFSASKIMIILAIIGTLGGTIGYQVRLTKIRYQIKRRGMSKLG